MDSIPAKRNWNEENDGNTRLMELEAIIREHLGSGKFFLVAAALREIDECNLYKPEKSIYTYAKNKFKFSRRTTNTYLCSASVYESIVEDNTLPIPVNISHIRSLHKFPAEVRRYIWRQVCDSGQNITEENVVAMTIKYETGVAFNNLNNEFYTPKNIIKAAKKVIGKNCFDLDPASCEFANGLHENKLAISIITEQTDGLQQSWYGDVWLNPPLHSEKNVKNGNYQGEWFISAQSRFQRHEIDSCFVLLKADFGKNWFLDTLKYPHCMFNKKIPFATPTGREKVLQDSSHMLVYMGPNIIQFCKIFGDMGSIPGYNSWSYNTVLTDSMPLSAPPTFSGGYLDNIKTEKRKMDINNDNLMMNEPKRVKPEAETESEKDEIEVELSGDDDSTNYSRRSNRKEFQDNYYDVASTNSVPLSNNSNYHDSFSSVENGMSYEEESNKNRNESVETVPLINDNNNNIQTVSLLDRIDYNNIDPSTYDPKDPDEVDHGYLYTNGQFPFNNFNPDNNNSNNPNTNSNTDNNDNNTDIKENNDTNNNINKTTRKKRGSTKKKSK